MTLTQAKLRMRTSCHFENSPTVTIEHFKDSTAELDEFSNTLELNEGENPILLTAPVNDLIRENESSPLFSSASMIDPFQPGHVIRDRYVIEEAIGQGGFATVYRAHDLRSDSADGRHPYVALKVLHPALRDCPRAIARLKREFRQTYMLSHPTIVRVFDLDVHEGVWFIVMELLEGETLDKRLRRLAGAAAPLAELLALLSSCADALSFAHERNIAHGDFKPANLFVLNDGAVRIVDFGGSSELNLCASGVEIDQPDRVATPAYASPQVLAGETAVPRDDLFSFACVAFETLAGCHPFAHRSSLKVQRQNGAVVGSSVLSPQQAAALNRGLSWSREDRPNSIQEFLHSLTA